MWAQFEGVTDESFEECWTHLLPDGRAFGTYADVITGALRDPAGEAGQQHIPR